MSETTGPKTPFAKLRESPPGSARPTRMPAIRSVLQVGLLVTFFSTLSAGSCGLVAGGMHGLAFAAAFFAAMGILGMALSLPVAVALDGTRAVRKGFAPIVRTEILERGAGQLAVFRRSGGALAVPSGERARAESADPERP